MEGEGGRGRRRLQTAILLSGKAAWPLALSRPPPLLLLLLLSDDNKTEKKKKKMKTTERERLCPPVYSSREAFICVVLSTLLFVWVHFSIFVFCIKYKFQCCNTLYYSNTCLKELFASSLFSSIC